MTASMNSSHHTYRHILFLLSPHIFCMCKPLGFFFLLYKTLWIHSGVVFVGCLNFSVPFYLTLSLTFLAFFYSTYMFFAPKQDQNHLPLTQLLHAISSLLHVSISNSLIPYSLLQPESLQHLFLVYAIAQQSQCTSSASSTLPPQYIILSFPLYLRFCMLPWHSFLLAS